MLIAMPARQRPTTRRAGTWLFGLTALGLAAGLQADPADELKQLRGRIERLQRQLSESEDSRSEAADALRESERAISAANRRVFQLSGRREELRTALAEARQRKELAQKGARKQQALLSRQLYRQYINGQPQPIRVLMSLQDPGDTARQLYYLGYVSRARAEVIVDLRQDLADIEQITVQMRDRSKELERLSAEHAEQKSRLEHERNAREKVLAQVSGDIERQRRQIGSLRRNEERLSLLIERLARELAKSPRPAGRARNEGLPDASANAAGSFRQLKGRLKLPVVGELANRFGAARSGDGLSWKGLFIASSEGQQVHAVAPGLVVFADWLRGFGNLMIVDHGGGYMSLYGNNESLFVQVGDNVKAGDAIATVGATGGNAETGLYFELRYQGKPFDPLTWVTLK